MIETNTASQPVVQTSLQDRISVVLVFFYQAIALLTFLVAPVLAINWFRTPFMGVLIEHTMVTNGVGPSVPGTWSAYAEGMSDFGSQLVAVNGESVRSAQELQRELLRTNVGDTIPVTFVTDLGEQKTIEVTLQDFPLADKFAVFFIPYIIGFIYFICSLWVFTLRRHDAAGRAFALFSTSAAIALALLFDLYSSNRLTPLWSTALVLGGSGMFIMAVLFPEQVDIVQKYPILRWLPAVPGIILVVNTWPTLYNLSTPLAYVRAWGYEYIFNGLAILSFISWTAIRFARSHSPITREQARIILWGSVFAFSPLGVWMVLASTIFPQFTFHPALLLPLILFPIATAYAILRYRLLSTDFIISRSLTYATLTILSIGVYVFLVWGSSLLLGRMISVNNPALVGAMIVVVALIFNPVRVRLQRQVDAFFFRGQAVRQEVLQNFSRELTQSVDLLNIIHLLRSYVIQNLNPSRLHIFIRDPLTDQYYATVTGDSTPRSDIRFSSKSALVQSLAHEKNSIFLSDTERLPQNLASDGARLALLNTQLFVALPGQQHLTGWLAMGSKKSGEPYSRRDLAFIESLSDQSALAIERAQVVFDLERRVHEMNVLARIAQGINVTVNFDDILELIYAQTSQVLKSQHFRVTIYDKVTETFHHVFYLENDERVTDKENRILPVGLDLEQEVVHSKRAIITEDYVRECRHRSYLASTQGIYAWIGVPLNTGNETIGAISLGSSDPSVVYSGEQLEILQAIADQAAGAIVKTRLLQESEHRARQLAMLNQVGRSLVTTLELDPLLHQILESAVEILNCEAGSLLLVDPQTEDLVFEVTVGPVAEDLTGKRLPPGTGMVGKAVDTLQPIIDNNVQQSKDWFEKADEETGFVTRAVLVVPMQVREEVIGVIEVLNKADGFPFTPDDQGLLAAFTAQAAVAVQNARLFMMTDQALAARVEELSVMQRIDRELNESLDLRRAMQITLDWAMRQSEASAGLVSMIEVEEDQVHVMASQGYLLDFELPEHTERFAGLPPIQELFKNSGAQNQLIRLKKGVSKSYLLPEAQSQVVIPVHREGRPIGLVFLESEEPEKFSQETVDFLTRLGDHAAIAISNSQLYTAVEAANIAKSDFISFVSHELKTPMTSIRGYTDLLAAGAVGTVNDAQSGFLTTIRSNVDRMATLVSDLADVSRIEAGRLRLEFGAVSLKDIFDEVIRSTKRQIDEKEQQLDLDIPEDLPMVWGDRTRLVQVAANLVSNAYKYTPDNGSINIVARHITNSLPDNQKSAVAEFVRLAVKDTGIGINPEDQKQIFTKFFRSDDPKAREAPGTGLGLNITKNLVELQGGNIWFESEYQKGTTFFFTVPVAETG